MSPRGKSVLPRVVRSHRKQKLHTGARSNKCDHLTPCGCWLGADCCLNCPLPDCVYTREKGDRWGPESKRAQLGKSFAIAQRMRAIAQDDAGTNEEVAARYGVSKRTVIRIKRLALDAKLVLPRY